MAGKVSNTAKINPWGEDNPEKLKQSSVKTIGWGQQLKGLFNPDSFMGQLNGEANPREIIPSRIEKQKVRGNEVVVFSHARNKEEQKIYQETHVILQKLKEQVTILEKSNKGLVSELSKVKIEQAPKKTGIYYIRFLEWLLTVVSQMRVRVEEGRAWLATFSQRKQKKMGYWKMYKKHGTTFGLSQERSLSTQTG